MTVHREDAARAAAVLEQSLIVTVNHEVLSSCAEAGGHGPNSPDRGVRVGFCDVDQALSWDSHLTLPGVHRPRHGHLRLLVNDFLEEIPANGPQLLRDLNAR